MAQIGENISIAIDTDGVEKCVFCGKNHQDEQAASPTTFSRDMAKLKREGREYTIENYASFYPSVEAPPLVEWDKDNIIGYKAAAHHCIALSSVSNHSISGELKKAGYDPNRGSNCSWLPYSKLQFIRARAYEKPLQKHRGGHTQAYFNRVSIHIKNVSKRVKNNFCLLEEKISYEELLEYMEVEENNIWRGIASSKLKAYHLYNHSYLEPSLSAAPWGAYSDEEGKEKTDIFIELSDLDDDVLAENDSRDDPETIQN